MRESEDVTLWYACGRNTANERCSKPAVCSCHGQSTNATRSIVREHHKTEVEKRARQTTSSAAVAQGIVTRCGLVSREAFCRRRYRVLSSFGRRLGQKSRPTRGPQPWAVCSSRRLDATGCPCLLVSAARRARDVLVRGVVDFVVSANQRTRSQTHFSPGLSGCLHFGSIFELV